MEETPPFDDAYDRFVTFVRDQGFSTSIVWAFHEDFTSHKREYWIRWPLPNGNEPLARQWYESGRKNGLGVTLSVLCRVDDFSVAYVWVPRDETDASYAMQSALKLQVPYDPIDARPIRNRLWWRIRIWLNERRGFNFRAVELPQRSQIAA